MSFSIVTIIASSGAATKIVGDGLISLQDKTVCPVHLRFGLTGGLLLPFIYPVSRQGGRYIPAIGFADEDTEMQRPGLGIPCAQLRSLAAVNGSSHVLTANCRG